MLPSIKQEMTAMIRVLQRVTDYRAMPLDMIDQLVEAFAE